MAEKTNTKIVKEIIEICNESLETDEISEGLKCDCGKVMPETRIDLWQPIDRSSTYMIRNTLKSLIEIGGINDNGKA